MTRSSDPTPETPAAPDHVQLLAEKLGLSRSTISRALHNDERISLPTRQRVQAAAEQAGYWKKSDVLPVHKNQASEVSPTFAPIIAYLNPQPERERWRSSLHWLYTFQGAMARARELGFELQEFWLGEPGMTPEAMGRILLSKSIRAVILGAPAPGQKVEFVSGEFAAVACDLEPAGEHFHRVSTDYVANTFKALNALRELGYRRIGLAMEADHIRYMHMLPRMAFLEFEESLPKETRTGYWLGAPDAIEDFARWMLVARPDAIVTGNWIPQAFLQPLGLRIPQDMGIAQLEPMFFPFQHSGIDGRYEQVGRSAVDLLIAQLHTGRFDPPKHVNHILNTGVWCPGFSTQRQSNPSPDRRFDALQVKVLEAVARGERAAFSAARLPLCQRNWGEGYALAAGVPDENWRPLSLAGEVNARWECPGWVPRYPAASPLPPLQGRHVFRGVPFEFTSLVSDGKDRTVSLNRANGNVASQIRKLSVNIHVRALYFFHLAFFAWDARPAGEYRLHFQSKRVEKIPLRPFFPPLEPAATATFHDSWPALPQFESDIAKPVMLVVPDSPIQFDRFGYVIQILNTQPEDRLVAIELVPNPRTDTVIILAGVTALLSAPEKIKSVSTWL